MSEKVLQRHLARKALLYVRQSTQYQVTHNEESRRLQYQMKQRLDGLGWKEVEIIDEDLGRSATSTAERTGFQRMVAEVCLGKIGVIAAREVSRFARNNRDWHQLIEMCSMVDTLLVDHEAIYDPRQANDRLLLGLKGSMSEYELDLLRQRSLAARWAKARRGELVIMAPVGFVKTNDQRLEKDPDQRVRQAIRLVFDKFFELGSARQTLMWFIEKGLEVPAQRFSTSGGVSTRWRRPAYGSIVGILSEPTYAGAYAYGRRTTQTQVHDGAIIKSSVMRPWSQWPVLLRDHHEGYITWEEFERVTRMLNDNAAGFLHSERRGPAKAGPALLAGLLRCGRCSRRLMVDYSGSGARYPRYNCHRGALDNGEPKCIGFGGLVMDEAIGLELLRVVRPSAIEASARAVVEEQRRQSDVEAALGLELKSARYEVDRAQRQFDAVDPANRLVADELERRWNGSLERMREVEARAAAARQQNAVAAPSASAFATIDEELREAWEDGTTDVRLKKRILRALIEEIVVGIDEDANEVDAVIHWKGGVHSCVRVPRRKRGDSALRTSKDAIDAIRALARICGDDAIAGYLNRNGLQTARGNRWTRERIAAIRSDHAIPVYSIEAQGAAGWMTLGQAAAMLGVDGKTLRRAVEAGELIGLHPLPSGPWVFRRDDLDSPLAQRLQEAKAKPAGPDRRQLDLLPTNT